MLRDGKQFQERYQLSGHAKETTTVQWSPCGKYIASGSKDSCTFIWDAITGKLLYKLKYSNLSFIYLFIQSFSIHSFMLHSITHSLPRNHLHYTFNLHSHSLTHPLMILKII